MADEDTDKLIQLVRERRLIYDFSHVDYKNRGKKVEAWLEVAAAMETGERKFWMTKWKTLRDNYNKFKKNNETPYKKYKNWPWAERMRFLDDCKTRRGTESAPPPRESRNASHSDSEPTTDNMHSVDESQITTHHSPENAPVSQIPKKRMKKRTGPIDEISEYLKQEHEQKSKLDGVDFLFLSYAQTFKKFPTRVQSVLKLEMAAMFARYELQAEGINK